MEAMPILSDYATYSHIKDLFKTISDLELGGMSYTKLKVTINISCLKGDCIITKVILVSPKHNRTVFFKKYILDHLRNNDISKRDKEIDIVLKDIHKTHLSNFNNGRYFAITDKFNSEKDNRGGVEEPTTGD